ncbi:MAG: RNA polymerase subunit sigma-70, partial [Luminiphilus sp.]
MSRGMVENKSDNETEAGRSSWSAPTGRRTDEWSECLVQIGNSNDRAAFTRFFRHFAPLIKAFALAGSSLSAAHA